mmetsp:Transcript_101040/g.326137  ORF Transcript_101040/g.326137 Transcript_101040/m.326137 type:complete len:317 (-) Transcript_101040:123-1073(-)
MVDYSKWDKLEVSDDEAEERPRVHKFEAPQSVTIGGKSSGGGVTARPQAREGEEEPEGDDPMEPADEEIEGFVPGEDWREEVLECRGLAERALQEGDAPEAVRLLEKAMRIGGAECPGLEEVLQSARKLAAAQAGGRGAAAAEAGSRPPSRGARASNGGAVADRYFWDQTKDSVEVCVLVPDDTKAKDVALTVSEESVSIAVKGDKLFAGAWEYKVQPEEDPDWEVKTHEGRRIVRLTVRKAEMPGHMSIVVWWSRVLKGEPSIDVSQIQDRKRGASESFAKAWAEAHARFREKVKCRVPVPIGGEDEDGSGAMDT